MHNLIIEYLLLSLLGMIIHISMKVLSRKNKTEKPNIALFLKNPMNWARMLLTMASTIAVLIMMDDIAKLLHINLEDGSTAKSVIAFLAGYSNHSLIRNLLKILGRK